MIKINYNKVYGDEDCKVTWKKTGHGDKCVKLTQTSNDEGDIDTFDYFVEHSSIIIETENCIIFKGCHSFNTVSKDERDFVPCDIAGQELEIAKQNI